MLDGLGLLSLTLLRVDVARSILAYFRSYTIDYEQNTYQALVTIRRITSVSRKTVNMIKRVEKAVTL